MSEFWAAVGLIAPYYNLILVVIVARELMVTSKAIRKPNSKIPARPSTVTKVWFRVIPNVNMSSERANPPSHQT